MKIQIQVDPQRLHPKHRVAGGVWYTAWLENHDGDKAMVMAAPAGPVAIRVKGKYPHPITAVRITDGDTATDKLRPVAAIEKIEATGPASWPRYMVWITYPHAGVDRPSTLGLSTGISRKLAKRLAAAIDAGAATSDQRIETDVNGRTYVASNCLVWGRTLSDDLSALGY